ncbi:hypothetical protein DSM43518_02270 [Mycobacterium marinum]|nr:hypothetical protein DSM43518_02270 [Mycobacterium marinum]RFZ22769.1 hypothetical protein DSM43519_02879 [Mycobacterium marinum]RFZ23589.1 hypothetical protein DSM44344_03101 [Mycobacterium marinum]
MSLDHIHLGSTHLSIGQRRPNHPLLRRPIRRSQAVGSPVLIYRRTAHHRQHRMPQPASIREPLDHDHTNTLTPPSAIGSRSKRLTPAVNSHPPLPRKLHKRRRGRHHRHATSQRQIAFTRTQRLHCQMQRHQRRRTRRIYRHRRTLQTQHICHPTRDHAASAAATQVPFDPGCATGAEQSSAIVVIHHSGEHASGRTRQRQRINPGVFQRLPRHLQYQPLLRVHRQRLTRTDPEELRIKISGLIQKPTRTGIRLPHRIRIRIKQPLHIPTAIGRETRHHIPTAKHRLPQRIPRSQPTRIATPHAHNRHRLE